MLKLLRTVGWSLLCLAAGGSLALAHHSANAEYDVEKMLSIDGVIEQIRDINPHAQWTLKVKLPAGTTADWLFDSQPLTGLRRQGLSVKSDLKIGTTVTVQYSPRRDGTGGGVLRVITVGGKTYRMGAN